MSTASNLANLLAIESDINYYTQLQIANSNKLKSNQELLKKQTSYEEKWENAFDDVMGLEDGKTKTIKGFTVTGGNVTEAIAEQYANLKVEDYDENKLIEYTDLDIKYDSINTMYGALLETLRTQKDGAKQATQTSAQDPHTLS